MTPVRSVLIASAISLATGAAFAGGSDQVFENLDVNNDDRIGAQEAKADPALDRVFEQADVNNTNSIDRQELAEAMRVDTQPYALFSSFDVDSDGAISWQEAQLDRDLAHVFATVDADRSSALTPDEFNNAVAMVASDSAPGRG